MAHPYPYPVLTPFLETSPPTFHSLRQLHLELNSNAQSVPSARGGGMFGHLALVVPATEYLALNGAIAYTTPMHPGIAPVHLPGATGPQITETNRAYLAAISDHRLHFDTEAALKAQLLAAVPSTFISRLSAGVHGLSRVSTLTILQHLDTQYGQFDNVAAAQNRFNMELPWTPDRPIETLWKQLHEAQACAAPFDPISDITLMRSALQNIERSGVLQLAVNEWSYLPEAEHTLSNLETFFNVRNRTRCREVTTAAAGFHALSIGTPQPHQPTPLHPELPAAPWIPVTSHRAAATSIPHTPGHPAPTLGYCWTHGLTTTHTSATCHRPRHGHITTATAFNRQHQCNLPPSAPWPHHHSHCLQPPGRRRHHCLQPPGRRQHRCLQPPGQRHQHPPGRH